MKITCLSLCIFILAPLFTLSQIDTYYSDIGYFEKTDISIAEFNERNYRNAFHLINEGKNPAFAYAVKGLMLMKLDQQPQAIKNLKRSIKISPSYLFPSDILAWHYLVNHEIDKSLKIATKAILADPSQKEAYLLPALFKLRKSYSDISDDGGAKEDFN